MSTPLGQQLEREVYEIMTRTLEAGLLGLIPENTHIYQQKAYYSEARKSYIRTDISLEVINTTVGSLILTASNFNDRNCCCYILRGIQDQSSDDFRCTS